MMQCIYHHSFFCSVWPSDWHSWPAKVIWRLAGSCVSCDIGSTRGGVWKLSLTILTASKTTWRTQGTTWPTTVLLNVPRLHYMISVAHMSKRDLHRFVVFRCNLWYCSAVLLWESLVSKAWTWSEYHRAVLFASGMWWGKGRGCGFVLRRCTAASLDQTSQVNRTLSQLPLVRHFWICKCAIIPNSLKTQTHWAEFRLRLATFLQIWSALVVLAISQLAFKVDVKIYPHHNTSHP